jgi:hypothetical protein
VTRILALQSVAGLGFTALDLRARGEVFGVHYGPPLVLIALELALSLAAGLLALAVHAGQGSALGPAVLVELAWIGAGVWAAMSGGGAAVGGAALAVVLLVRIAAAGTRSEARALAPYDQEVQWDRDQGYGFTVTAEAPPFDASGELAKPGASWETGASWEGGPPDGNGRRSSGRRRSGLVG